LKWWPYWLLPAPRIIYATVFPTLYTWREKNIWEKMVGIVAAPSVFLLTITLPIVETEKQEEEIEDGHIPTLSLPGSLSYDSARSRPRKSTVVLEPDTSTEGSDTDNGSSPFLKTLGGHGNTATTAANAEDIHDQHYHHHSLPPAASPLQPHIIQSPMEMPIVPASASAPAKDWNRWLVILQTFTAPFFIVLIFWANSEYDNPNRNRALIKPSLYSLLASMIILALILSTTTPTRPPRWRVLLCFLGFCVAIAWISTIANEVVGVLKTLGVVLDISDAILGLTIFAVGNSLGDLVADITVARLGYPVMALSACFGGPMLNILLGIGISGIYMTIGGANHRHHKHPDRPTRFKPFHVEVSSTLIISGITLLVTLVGLLVAVPFRKWKMDRWVGWGLVVLWVISTVGNVVLEVLGYGKHFGEALGLND